MYRILNYTRIKLRSRPPHKKSTYFMHPDFSVAKSEKKCANYASKYGIYIYIYIYSRKGGRARNVVICLNTQVAGSYGQHNKPSGSIECRELFRLLRNS